MTIPEDVPNYIVLFLRRDIASCNPGFDTTAVDQEVARAIARDGWRVWEEDASLWADDNGIDTEA